VRVGAHDARLLRFAFDDVNLTDEVERFLCFRVLAVLENLAARVRVIPSAG
jgi:hypothetical protein